MQSFGVNNLNELTTATRSGSFTVAGTATLPSGNDPIWAAPGVTNVTVSGTGLSSGPAEIYGDGTWARTNATLANGANSYTATAKDTYNRTDSSTVSVSLPATNTFTYDLNGNLLSDGTRNFSYDDENQLISVWVTNAWRSDFAYDGMLRRRVRKEWTWTGSWVQTNEVRYVYDGMLVIQERDTNNFPQVTYTRGTDLGGSLQSAGGIGGLLARTDNHLLTLNSTAAHAYYHCDGNGNITALVDTNGYPQAKYEYDPYGNTIAMSGPLASVNPYRFSTKEFHQNSGLYYYGFRFYDSSLQRWLNQDPLGDIGSLVYQTAGIAPWDESDDSSEMAEGDFFDAWTQVNRNLFKSLGNNPVGNFDAFGLVDDSLDACARSNPGELGKFARDAANEGRQFVAENIAKQKANEALKRSTLDAIQKSKVFRKGVKIDVNKLKQALNRDQLQKAKEIAQDAIKYQKEMLKKAVTEKERGTALNAIETQLNRARACKQALAP